MKYSLSYILCCICVPLFLFACANDTDPEVNNNGSKVDPGNKGWTGVRGRTVLVYMASENNLGTNGFAANDIKEMEDGAKALPDDVNLILFQDATNTNSKLYKIDRNGRKEVKDYGEDLVSTDAGEFKKVVSDVESMYPAKEYGMLMWSHASGWQPANLLSLSGVTRSFGQDSNTGSLASKMDIPKMADVLRSFPKFKYIMFDACFMQCIEVAYDLKDVADYLIGAPCEIPGPGAYYNKLVPAMFSNDPAHDLVDNYWQPYKAENDKNPSGEYGAVIAALDCSQVDNFTAVTREVLPAYQENMSFDTGPLQVYLPYDTWVSDQISPYYDMKGEMQQVLSAEDYEKWEAALEKLIVAKGATQSFFSEYHNPNIFVDQAKFSGLAGYIPHFYPGSGKWDALFRKTTWYEAAGWKEKGW